MDLALAGAGVREREPGVRMWLDAAGNHDLAGRVDHLPDVATERAGLGDGHDGFTLHGDVPRAHAPRRHDAPTTNDEIEHDPCSLVIDECRPRSTPPSVADLWRAAKRPPALLVDTSWRRVVRRATSSGVRDARRPGCQARRTSMPSKGPRRSSWYGKATFITFPEPGSALPRRWAAPAGSARRSGRGRCWSGE